MRELATAFTEADPREALRRFTGCFGTFWAVDRTAMRRLRALAALDPDVGAVISARDERRREGLTVLVDRLAEATALAAEPGHAVRVLFALTSFETFDALAGPGQDLTAVVPDVNKLAEAALQLTWREPGSSSLTSKTRVSAWMRVRYRPACSAGVLQARGDAVDGEQEEPLQPRTLSGIVRGRATQRRQRP